MESPALQVQLPERKEARTVRLKIIRGDLKEAEKKEEKELGLLIRDFYELKVLFKLIKDAEEEKVKGNKNIVISKIEKILKKLRRTIPRAGEERIERRMARNYEQLRKILEDIKSHVIQVYPHEIEEINHLLEQAEVFNADLEKLGSRTGEIEEKLRASEKDISQLDATLESVKTALKDVQSFEEVINQLLCKTKYLLAGFQRMKGKKEPKVRHGGLNAPAFMSTSKINVNGIPGKRLMTVYRTVGCEYDKKGKGCSMCDFASYANPNIQAKNVKAQHYRSLGWLRHDSFIHFDLLTLGNFYNDREISADLRKYLLEAMALIPSVMRVLTEARRQYITLEKLQEAKSYLRKNQILEYALGYETVNPHLRNRVLRKGTPEHHLDEALDICKAAGVDFVSYVLIKPHTITEAEGIDEAVNTAVHVLAKAEQHGVNGRIAFEPVFVTQGKIIEQLWKKGNYVPPKLWSVAEVLIKTAERLGVRNTNGKLFVGLSDENLSKNRMAHNPCTCDARIRQALQDFNGHQNVAPLKRLTCNKCKAAWVKEVGKK